MGERTIWFGERTEGFGESRILILFPYTGPNRLAVRIKRRMDTSKRRMIGKRWELAHAPCDTGSTNSHQYSSRHDLVMICGSNNPKVGWIRTKPM